MSTPPTPLAWLRALNWYQDLDAAERLKSPELELGERLGVAKRRLGSSFRCIDWLGGVLSKLQTDDFR